MAVFQIGQQAIKPSAAGEVTRGLQKFRAGRRGTEQQKLQDQLAQLKLQQLRAQIRQIGVPTGASDLATQKANAFREILDPNTPPEKKKLLMGLMSSGAQQTVNISQGGLAKGVGEQLKEFKQAQTDINKFAANPENADLAKGFDVGIKTDAKGNLVLNVVQKARPTSEQVNKQEFLRLLRVKVDRLKEISAKTKKLTGPITGRVRGMLAETIGGQNEFVELKQILDSLIIRVYMLSGKQINETELKFLQSIQPQANDPADTYETRLNGFFNELKVISEITDALWQETGIRMPPTGAPGKKEIKTLSASQAQKLLDAAGGDKDLARKRARDLGFDL